jgi:hypothetical protein
MLSTLHEKVKSILAWKPKAAKSWLYTLAGLMWAGVGVMLNRYAYQWLTPLELGHIWWFLFWGTVLAWLIYYLGFSRLAVKNIKRIESINVKKPCLFAFQQWTSYPLVLVMISMGVCLRKFSPFPKTYLASLYIGIGGGLFLASLHYFKKIFDRLPAAARIEF